MRQQRPASVCYKVDIVLICTETCNWRERERPRNYTNKNFKYNWELLCSSKQVQEHGWRPFQGYFLWVDSDYTDTMGINWQTFLLHKTLHPEQRSRNNDYSRVGRSKVRNAARARDFFLFSKIPKEPPTWWVPGVLSAEVQRMENELGNSSSNQRMSVVIIFPHHKP